MKTRIKILLCLMLLPLALCAKGDRIKTISFFGFENPESNPDADFVELPKWLLKEFKKMVLNQEKEAMEKAISNQHTYFYKVELQNSKTHIIKLYVEGSYPYSITSDPTNYFQLKDSENWLGFLESSKDMYYNKTKRFLGLNQIFASELEEEQYLQIVQSKIKKLPMPKDISRNFTEELNKNAGNSIAILVTLYERYYNFSKVKELITKELTNLSSMFCQNKLPVFLSVSGDRYKPMYEIMRADGKMNQIARYCYIGNCIVTPFMQETMEIFNSIPRKYLMKEEVKNKE